MAVASSPMPHHVHKLPVEVVQSILGFLPDIESVANASMSCWQWQNGLRAFEAQILKKVLFREMGNLADLHPGAIEALQIPFIQDLPNLAKILSFFPNQPSAKPCPSRESLVRRARLATEIQDAIGLASVDPEKSFDLFKGPYNLKKALDITQTHQAHRKLADEYFAAQNLRCSADLAMPSSSRSNLEAALWRFESFCRIFGGQLWYRRWHKSICFATIIKAYWEGFTLLQRYWMHSAHTFLVEITETALQDNEARAMRAACVPEDFYEPCTCELCQERTREIEGAIATGLVGILAHRNDDFVPRRREHPFFLADFLKCIAP